MTHNASSAPMCMSLLEACPVFMAEQMQDGASEARARSAGNDASNMANSKRMGNEN